MNNSELFELFRTIDAQKNCFDRFLMLKKYRKEYRTSDFYKQTRCSIFKAYKIYQTNALHAITAFINGPVVASLLHGDLIPLQLAAYNFFDSFDMEHLDKIFAYFENKLNEIQIDSMSMGTELRELMKEFTKSIGR